MKAAIIGSVIGLTACSTLKLAYNSAPQLTWWWMDSYLDFSGEQSPAAKEAVEHWFSWHRQTQLIEYADWLAGLALQVERPVSADAVCGLFEQMRQKLQPAFEQAYTLGARLAPQLTTAQVKRLESRYAEANAEFRKDYVQADPAKRREQSIERAVERYERLYGRLGDAQRSVIKAAAVRSPFEPRLSLVDRERRQQDVLQLLRRWLSERPTPPQALVALRQLGETASLPTDPVLRDYQRRLEAHGCQLSADLHNSTSTEQRSHARKQIKSWEADLRALAAERRAAP